MLGWVVAVILTLLPGCASIANANYAYAMDAAGHLADDPKTAAGLVISGEEDESLSSAYIGVVDVTFENRTSHWIHVKGIALGFGGGDKDRSVWVPMGEPLESWAKAAAQEKVIRRHNETVALSALAVTGAVAGAAGAATHNKGLAATGAVLSAGSLAGLAGSEINEAVKASEAPYYENHLLAVPFSIPPGLFTKRWIALNTKGTAHSPCIDAMLIVYEFDNGGRERVWLSFRDHYSRSRWQEETCSSPSPPATPGSGPPGT